jgi:hypothetical protein
MSNLNYAILVIIAFSNWRCIYASDLELTIRPHTRKVVFGDPLYLEATIINHGEAVITAPFPSLSLRNFDFRIYDRKTELEMTSLVGGGFGAGDDVKYEPAKAQKHYWIIFMPPLVHMNHPFWKPMQDGREILVWGKYSLGSGLSLSSKGEDVYVARREPEELEIFEHWSRIKVTDYEDVPHVASFGLQVKAVNHRHTLELASKFKTGEIADLLQLTIQLQNLHTSPPDSREPANRALVEWLKAQPEIKRQALTAKVRSLAESHRMHSTMEAVQALIDNP